MQIDEFLDAATRRPWLYGGGPDGWRGHDCLLFIANWSHARLGTDPADDLRGTYSTKEEAEALLNKAGGYSGMMAARMATAGWRLSPHPASGDVGVISIAMRQGEHLQRPAIRRFSKWIVPWERGLLPFTDRAHCLVAWRPK